LAKEPMVLQYMLHDFGSRRAYFTILKSRLQEKLRTFLKISQVFNAAVSFSGRFFKKTCKFCRNQSWRIHILHFGEAPPTEGGKIVHTNEMNGKE